MIAAVEVLYRQMSYQKVDTKEAWILALRCGNALPKFVKLVFAPQISNMVYSFGKLGFKPEQTLLACAQNAMQDC